jgi:hypothetical protein
LPHYTGNLQGFTASKLKYSSELPRRFRPGPVFQFKALGHVHFQATDYFENFRVAAPLALKTDSERRWPIAILYYDYKYKVARTKRIWCFQTMQYVRSALGGYLEQQERE